MKWLFSFVFGKQAARDDDLSDRYQEVRKAAVQLNLALAKEVPKAAVPECGKKLGLVKAGTLILNNDDEIAIVYDYCFHHYRRADKSVLDRHREQHPPAPGSTEAALLEAMGRSRYSLFRVEAIQHRRRGASLCDLLGGERFDLIDIALSETAEPGLIVAGRLLPLPGFAMSSGTLIPVAEPVYEDKMRPVIRKYYPDPTAARPAFSDAQAASFEAQIIRIALREGGEDNVFYTDAEH
ncbi:hypothetical protein SAMN02949497_1073 [Methylomagnum ishizawai]|uniref:Uncharacterized protein n=1 Tax=Methylomagnum ishizawai TaxID=1760988 RepID=A0A1Y6CTM7_9GAMM|nr:hypothetical protein [Methylomagnum ishizawai]SMF93781.1 hypothetical protein SAMN02949497_1073 [Methylomagnum ishizawai]